MPVTDIKILKETKNYRITLCNISTWGSDKLMERLELKIKGKWIFVQNYYHFKDEKDFEEYSDALSHAKQFNPKKGWFKNYGQGSPLDQFKKTIKFRFSKEGSLYDVKNFDQLEHSFTELEKTEHVWTFHGNHKKISAAFQFLVWNTELKNKIRKTLLGRKYDGFVCNDKICKGSVILTTKKQHKEFHTRVKLRCKTTTK